MDKRKLKKKVSNSSGITLLNLIIVILVILIISGTAVYNGMNSLEDSKVSAFISEMQIIQSKVNLISEKIGTQRDETPKRTTINDVGYSTLNYPTNYKNGDELVFNTTGTGSTGSIIYYTIPVTAEIQIEAFGAAGSLGNASKGNNYGGKGAYIKTDKIALNAGDRLLIVVGQKRRYKSRDI